MSISKILLLLLTVNAILSHGQIGKKINEFRTDEPVKASLDRLGNLYLVTKKNVLRKFDTDGKFLNEFTNPDSLRVTGLEPWNPLRIFVYSAATQKILLLDRFLVPETILPVDPALAVEPVLASPLPNNNFWLLDKADQSLKKINPEGTQVLSEINLKVPAGSSPSFTFLREYQNLLFLIDPASGLHIFSNVGKPIRTLSSKNLQYIGFLGEEIYILEQGLVRFYDLYSEGEHTLNVDPAARFVLITDERLIVVKTDKVDVYEYKPKGN